jgi:hypothetical protein
MAGDWRREKPETSGEFTANRQRKGVWFEHRDTIIGRDPVTRSQRLKLVVQLRRFLVLDQARRPNLASQCLGLGLRELPAQWLDQHGYRPLMAESFSDPESHAGTGYKATNWTYAGDTKDEPCRLTYSNFAAILHLFATQPAASQL